MILYMSGTYVAEGERVGLSTTFEEGPASPDINGDTEVFNLNIK